MLTTSEIDCQTIPRRRGLFERVESTFWSAFHAEKMRSSACRENNERKEEVTGPCCRV